MGLIKTLFTQAFPPALKGYYDSILARLTPQIFDDSNTASGASPIVLNTINGAVVFSDAIPAGESVSLRITNSLITAGTKLNIGLIYPSFATNGIVLLAGYGCSSGFVDIFLYNVDAASATSGVEITFQILNP